MTTPLRVCRSTTGNGAAMSLRLVARSTGAAAAVLLALSVPAAQGTVAHGYHAYGSCATSAPFTKATSASVT